MTTTREDVVEKTRANVRNTGAEIASHIFTDSTFQHEMNRWMQGTHVLWGVFLALMFIGLNGFVITLVELFGVKWWQVSATFTPIGAGYTAWQYFKWRTPSKNRVI